MATSVPYGQLAYFVPPIEGQDSNGNTQVLGSLTASIDDYTNFFVAFDQFNHLCVVPRANLPGNGAVTAANVTFAGTSANGTALPNVTVSFEFTGAPAPIQAATINVPTPTLANLPTTATDPGSATVSFPASLIT